MNVYEILNWLNSSGVMKYTTYVKGAQQIFNNNLSEGSVVNILQYEQILWQSEFIIIKTWYKFKLV